MSEATITSVSISWGWGEMSGSTTQQLRRPIKVCSGDRVHLTSETLTVETDRPGPRLWWKPWRRRVDTYRVTYLIDAEDA